MKLFFGLGVSKKKMGKKKANVRAGIPKFQPPPKEKDNRWQPCDQECCSDNLDEEVLICMRKDDFKYDYDESGICVLTTLGCIQDSIHKMAEKDRQVNQRKITRQGNNIFVEGHRKVDWKGMLKQLKDKVEERTPEELWEMGEGQVWQDWIDAVCQFYFVRAHITGIKLSIATPMKSMRGVTKGNGDCNITIPENFNRGH